MTENQQHEIEITEEDRHEALVETFLEKILPRINQDYVPDEGLEGLFWLLKDLDLITVSEEDLVRIATERLQQRQAQAATGDHQLPTPGSKPRTSWPDKYIYPTDNVTKTLFSGAMVPGQIHEVKIGKDKTGDIRAKIRVNYDQLAGIEFQTRGKALTTDDKEILNAIITLRVEGGNLHITPEDVYRIIIGKPRAKCPAERRRQITETIEMLRETKFAYNWTELSRYKGLDLKLRPGRDVGDTHILDLSKVVDGLYYMEAVPMLYRFAASLGQIGRIPLDQKSLPGNASSDRTKLQTYLRERCDIMRVRKDYSRNIRFDTLFKDLGLLDMETGDTRSDAALKMKRSRIYDTVKKLLSAWEADGIINGYTVNMRGRQYESVTIDL